MCLTKKNAKRKRKLLSAYKPLRKKREQARAWSHAFFSNGFVRSLGYAQRNVLFVGRCQHQNLYY